jgi:hypothetical protein
MEEIALEAKKAMEYLLTERGWVPMNAAGDIASPNHLVWFSIGYAHGEYTFAASLRRNGFGPSLGMYRTRIVGPLCERYPDLGTKLAQNLADTAGTIEELGVDLGMVCWPPPLWQDVHV